MFLMNVTVASSPEETDNSLSRSFALASISSSGHSSSWIFAILSSSYKTQADRFLVRIKDIATFFFFCRAFIASRFRLNFSLCSASLERDGDIFRKEKSVRCLPSQASLPRPRWPWSSRSSSRCRARSSASPSPSPSQSLAAPPPCPPCVLADM